MQKIFVAIIILLFSNLSFSKEANFNDMFIFGDSLNDNSHTGKAVAGGDYYPAQGEILSEKLLNRPLLDFRENGNNYSNSGFQIFNALNRYNKYFNKSNIGENNLFYLPIGNNDAVITNVLLHPTPFLEIHHSSDKVIEKRAERWKNLAIELGNNGKNTIITTTLFDMSLTPLPLFLTAFPRYDIVSYLDVLLLNGDLHYHLNDVIASLYNFSNKHVVSDILWNLGIFTDNKWKDFINSHPKANDGVSGDEYLKYLSREIYQQTIGGKILSIVMYPVMDYLKILFHDYTHKYSDTIQKKLASTNENIIFIDFEKALLEIYENPKRFGFDNIISPQCAIGLAALHTGICNKNSDFFTDDGKHYLFGDLVHPSGYAHKVAAQYIMSVINAPIYFTSIAKNLSNNNFAVNEYLKDQLNTYRLNPSDEKYNLLFSYSGYLSKGLKQNGVIRKNTFYNNLNLGLLYNIDEKNSFGSLLSVNFGKIKPYDDFRYDSSNQKISMFYQLKIDDNFWTNFAYGYSRLSASNITRKIITDGYIFEKGKTHANANNFNINMGYDFNQKNNFIITPYVGYSYNRYKVNAYQDFDKNSTSMKFDSIHVNENYANIGIQLNTKDKPVDISLDLSYNKNFSNKQIEVSSGLKNAPRNYTRVVNFSNKYWGNIKLGLNKKLKNNININAHFGYRINPSKSSNDFNFNLGVDYKF